LSFNTLARAVGRLTNTRDATNVTAQSLC